MKMKKHTEYLRALVKLKMLEKIISMTVIKSNNFSNSEKWSLSGQIGFSRRHFYYFSGTNKTCIALRSAHWLFKLYLQCLGMIL